MELPGGLKKYFTNTMISGFWKNLPKPFFALAPMANITDCAMRQNLIKIGRPDVMWTEFVSVDGLMSRGLKNILIDLKFSKNESPIVAQLFGCKPDNFYRSALLLQEMGFDGIDINMGCPDKNVEKQGSGCSLIKNYELAKKVIEATKAGAGKLPVSVKTRIGYSQDELETWLPTILETEPAAVTLHCRTRKELWTVPAHWDRMAEAVKIRDKYDSSPTKTLIIGNGDVTSYADGLEKAKQSGVDGVMIGRAILNNPWIFRKDIDTTKIGIRERLETLKENVKLHEELLLNYKGFGYIKKFYHGYINGFPQAKEYRTKLMLVDSVTETIKIIDELLKENPS